MNADITGLSAATLAESQLQKTHLSEADTAAVDNTEDVDVVDAAEVDVSPANITEAKTKATTETESWVEEILNGCGYVVLSELISPEEASEARSLVLEITAQERPQGKTNYDNNRERVYGLIYKGKVFERMVQHPCVMAIAERVFGYTALGGFSAHVLYPGATPMGAHVDYPYFVMDSPYPAQPVMEIQTIWMVEDFTEDNGAPIVLPHSQKRCTKPDPVEFAETGQKITGKAGTVIISHGLLWHNTSDNQSEQPRVSLLGNYTPRYIRPIEDPWRDFDEAIYQNFSHKLQWMLCLDFQKALFG